MVDRQAFASSSLPGAELVFGIVAPVGTDVDFVERTLRDRLLHFHYSLETVRLSKLIAEFSPTTKLETEPHHARIRSHMDAGDELRSSWRPDVLAVAAVREVKRLRGADARGPKGFTAYFLRTLKHPDEVKTLREVYGRGFFLLGASASKELRLNALTAHKNVPHAEASDLLARDESAPMGHGQQTRAAFHLADAFVALTSDQAENTRGIWRILDILFGRPSLTPTMDEYAMFLAYAASVRSGALSRQVGAVIVSKSNEVIATGANEVPKAGGGSFLPTSHIDDPNEHEPQDNRDWAQGRDANQVERERIAAQIVEKVVKLLREDESNETASMDSRRRPEGLEQALSKALRGSPLKDLTEFGRAVHAEMDALMASVRVGVSVRRGTLYCTTFPCHNCSKHIVASGLNRVVFIEPYPKSRALELHGDAIVVQGASSTSPSAGNEQDSHQPVMFEPFRGIGPRKYLDLFSLTLSTGRPMDRKRALEQPWSRTGAHLRVSMVPTSYLEREYAALDALENSNPGKQR